MFKFFKNLIKNKTKIKNSDLNAELINSLYTLYYDNLEKVFLDPVNRLYIINVYYPSLHELIDSLVIGSSDKSLYSINLNSYFRHTHDYSGDTIIKILIRRLIDILSNTKINSKAEHDILELISAYNYLKEH